MDGGLQILQQNGTCSLIILLARLGQHSPFIAESSVDIDLEVFGTGGVELVEQDSHIELIDVDRGTVADFLALLVAPHLVDKTDVLE